MILFGFRLGQIWLDAEKYGRFSDLPTAEQFTFIMNMCSGGTFLVLLDYLIFLSPYKLNHTGFWPVRDQNRQSIRPILRWTSVVFVLTLSTTLAIQAVDAWIHKTLRSTSITSIKHDVGSRHNYSRILRPICLTNETGSMVVGVYGQVDSSCVFDADGYLYKPVETFATITKTSTENLVRTQNETAYITPAELGTGIQFKAQTIGVATTCQPIISSCNLEYPSSGYASFTCGGEFSAISGLMYGNQIFEVQVLNSSDHMINPFWLSSYGCFKDYTGSLSSIDPTDYVNISTFNTGVYVGIPQSCTILACAVEIQNMNYSTRVPTDTGSSTEINVTLLNDEAYLSSALTTRALVGAISQSYGVDQISLGVTSAAIRANTSRQFADLVALSISKTILGESTGVFDKAPSLEEFEIVVQIGTKVPVPPVIVFLILQLFLTILALAVAIASMDVDRSRGGQAVKSARHALINVETFVIGCFGDEPVYPPTNGTEHHVSSGDCDWAKSGPIHTATGAHDVRSLGAAGTLSSDSISESLRSDQCSHDRKSEDDAVLMCRHVVQIERAQRCVSNPFISRAEEEGEKVEDGTCTRDGLHH